MNLLEISCERRRASSCGLLRGGRELEMSLRFTTDLRSSLPPTVLLAKAKLINVKKNGGNVQVEDTFIRIGAAAAVRTTFVVGCAVSGLKQAAVGRKTAIIKHFRENKVFFYAFRS